MATWTLPPIGNPVDDVAAAAAADAGEAATESLDALLPPQPRLALHQRARAAGTSLAAQATATRGTFSAWLTNVGHITAVEHYVSIMC